MIRGSPLACMEGLVACMHGRSSLACMEGLAGFKVLGQSLGFLTRLLAHQTTPMRRPMLFLGEALPRPMVVMA